MMTRTPLFLVAMFLQVGLLVMIPFSPRDRDTPRDEGTLIRLAVEEGSFPQRDTGNAYHPRLLIATPEGVDGWRELPIDTPICAVLVPGEDGLYTVATIETRWPRHIPADAVILRGYTTLAALRYDRLHTYRFNRVPPGNRAPMEHVVVEATVSADGVGRIVAVEMNGRRF